MEPRQSNLFKILLVEDDLDFARMVLEALNVLGYATQGAHSAEEALEYIENEQFAVLMVDIQLPGISGIELAKQVAVQQPATKIIFMTGLGYLLANPLPFQFTLLAKPFCMDNLKDALADIPLNTEPLGVASI